MKTFSISSKVFYKNSFLLTAYCLFLAIININFIRIYIGLSSYNQPPFVFLSESLMMSIFCSVFFMFLSYEVFFKIKSSNLDECLVATKNGNIKLVFCQSILMVLLILAVTVTVFIYNFIYSFKADFMWEYFLHMVYSIFSYLFIVPLLGAFIGICAALAFKRVKAYLLMVLFVLLSSPLASVVAFGVSEATGYKVNITPIFDIFNIYPPNLDYSPIYGFGISLLPCKFEAMFFWIFAAVAVVLLKITKKNNFPAKIIVLCCIAACLFNFAALCMPSSKVDMSYRLDGTLLADAAYYESLYKNGYPEEEEAEFKVLNYNLDLTVKNQLYAETKVKVNKNNLPVYKFTLYHNFKIKEITDQNGTSLKFKQESDHVEVYSAGNLISEIRFMYSGYNPRFYTNSQGVFLPGYFAYYPVAGFYNVHSPDCQYYIKMPMNDEINFNLKIKSHNQQIFTNISQNSDGSFSGKATGLTVMSGFIKSTMVNGIEVIYPYFDTALYDEKTLKKDMDEFIKVKQDDVIKKIFIVPGLNQKGDSTVVFSDYITTEYIMITPEFYVYGKILDGKASLYSCQESYLNDKKYFNERLEMERDYPIEFEDDKIYTRYQEKINQLGEKRVISETEKFIFNNHDRRFSMEFLNQLN